MRKRQAEGDGYLFRSNTRCVENLHQLVKDQETDIDTLRERNYVATYRILELNVSGRMLLGDLSHNGVGDSVPSTEEHIDVGRIEKFGESIYKI
jgi:hypothetical protein